MFTLPGETGRAPAGAQLSPLSEKGRQAYDIEWMPLLQNSVQQKKESNGTEA